MNGTALSLAPLLAAFACACGASHDADAPADAPADATTAAADAVAADAAAATAIRVRVLTERGDARPVAGALVIVASATGAATAITDADGRAEVTAGPDATVSVVRPDADVEVEDSFTATTLVGAQPGDDLVFGLESPAGEPHGGQGEMTMRLPAAYPGAVSHDVYSPCSFRGGNHGTGEVRMTIDLPCPAGGFDVAVVARDARGQAIASLLMAGQTFTPGGTLQIDGTWQTATVLKVGYPAVSSTPVMSYWYRLLYRGGRTGDGDGHLAPPSAEVAIGVPALVDAVVFHTRFVQDGGQQTRRSVLAPTAIAPMLPTAPPLPWLGEPSLDAAGARVTWKPSADATYDVTILSLGYRDRDDHPHAWLVVAPPGLREVRLPDLSAAGALAPVAASLSVRDLAIVDVAGFDGYAALRARAVPTVFTLDGSSREYSISERQISDDVRARPEGRR